MVFTDDDLKRWKELLIHPKDPYWYKDNQYHETAALIARLEAAEKFSKRALESEPYLEEIGEYQSWRKAAGK